MDTVFDGAGCALKGYGEASVGIYLGATFIVLAPGEAVDVKTVQFAYAGDESGR